MKNQTMPNMHCVCPKWATQHTELENKVRKTINSNNLMSKILTNNNIQNNFQKLCHAIMKQKQRKEKEVETANKHRKRLENNQDRLTEYQRQTRLK